MATFCPHCHEEVDADELIGGDDVWVCANCGEPNNMSEDECNTCGLSRETSDYLEGNE